MNPDPNDDGMTWSGYSAFIFSQTPGHDSVKTSSGSYVCECGSDERYVDHRDQVALAALVEYGFLTPTAARVLPEIAYADNELVYWDEIRDAAVDLAEAIDAPPASE